jgi:hypothetical protein
VPAKKIRIDCLPNGNSLPFPAKPLVRLGDRVEVWVRNRVLCKVSLLRISNIWQTAVKKATKRGARPPEKPTGAWFTGHVVQLTRDGVPVKVLDQTDCERGLVIAHLDSAALRSRTRGFAVGRRMAHPQFVKVLENIWV